MIVNVDHVLAVLKKVRFAPSCVDMGWKWEATPAHGNAPGFLLRTSFMRPDRDTGLMTYGFGRWWHVPDPATENAIVKTAFAAAKMILEHELMESFHFNGFRLFDPHHDLDDLCAAAVNHALTAIHRGAGLPIGDAVNTGKPELVFDPDTKTYGIVVDRVEVIRGLDPIGLRHGGGTST